MKREESASFKKDLQYILKKIDLEIEFIENEITDVDSSVKEDLDSILLECLDPIKNKDQYDLLYEKYFEFLKNKKLIALNTAKNKLEKIKRKIELALTIEFC